MTHHNDNTVRSVNAAHAVSAASPSSGTLSPLRKAISLSTLFRSNSDGKSTTRPTPSAPLPPSGVANVVNGVEQQQRIAAAASSSNGAPSPSVVVTPPSTLRPLKRMRRRLSLRSPSMSPSVASSGVSVTTPTFGTPSSIASVSTPASSSSSFRGRPRSGSCRASLLGGSSSGARILPFTLPTVNGTVDELVHDETPKGNRTSSNIIRSSAHSVSPSLVPRRPITPAPLLMLDEEMNSLGITTGSAPSSDWHVVSPRTSLPPQSVGRSTFLAPQATTTANGLSTTSRLIGRNASQESFQCRGEESMSNARPKVPTEMTRSASANTATTGGKSSQAAVIVPGSPLGWRRRPWALSLQLQSSSSSNPLQTELLPPASSLPNHASFRSVIDSVRDVDEDKSRRSSRSTAQTSLDPRSHFSSSSEGDRTQSMIHIGMDESEPEEEEGEQYSASASSVTSPASTWSSSAFSFDTTLESPESRHSQRFSAAANASTLRRRSNTVSIIPMSDPTSKRPTTSTSITPTNNDPMPLPDLEVPNICPASPPLHVRLRLTMPPTAKQAGVPSEDVMHIPMTATTLDFKEAICHSLTSRYGLSISPSQLGLFVVDLLKSPDQMPSGSPPLRSSSPRSPSMLANAILGGGNAVSEVGSTQEGTSGYSFLRSRSRLRTSLAHQHFPKATVSTSSPIFRQLDNDVALYQEGLQDDDAVIVRF